MSKKKFKPVDPHPNFPKLEEEILDFWEKEKIFEQSVKNREGEESFVFFEGPPTANAAPALHHVIGRTFKDLIPRFQTMRGKYVLRKGGWDTHGLPVEIQIEKKLGISGKPEIENIVPGDRRESIIKFNNLCRESVWDFKTEWDKLTKRMAFWVDLSDPYITYDKDYIESVWWIFSELEKRDLLYQGYKVVPYCPRCGTALSSHEVADGYKEIEDRSVFVKFKLKPGQKIGGFETDDNTYILSWTTTPWTLPGNVALAVGEEIEYSKVTKENSEGILETWILAKEIHEQKNSISEVQAEFGGTESKAPESFKGKDLVGLKYQPLFKIPELKNNKSHQIYPADFVNTEEGTGVVHTAVMYGEDDYNLGTEVDLPKFHTVDEEGKFLESVPVVGGMSIVKGESKDKDTEQKIIDYLKKNDFLFAEENYKHTYPHCWRCQTPLLYYARDSWYVAMSKLRDQLIKNNREVKWVPQHMQEGRFGEWLREVKDSAISRDRYWGTPLPIWECEEKDCTERKVISSYAKLEKLATESLPKDFDPHKPYIDDIKLKCQECDGQMSRTPEVIDVWFDSGAMPFAQWHYPHENQEMIDQGKQFPADYISEGVDQTRGWFYSLLAIATALDQGPAYKQVISYGHILDEKGQKMSKSKGNIVDPWQLFNKQGADALRWYLVMMNQPGESKLFSEKDLETTQRKTFKTFWNVYNYFLTYAEQKSWEFDEKAKENFENSKSILDQWLNARLQLLANNVTDYLEELDPFRAAREVEAYVNDLSTWYLRRNRGRTDNHFFAALFHNLINFTKIIAPFAPFFAEIIYQNLNTPGFAKSVHLRDWPEVKQLSDQEQSLLTQMSELRKTVEQVHALRAKDGIKLRQPLAKLTVSSDFSDELLEILKDEVNVKEIKFGKKLKLDTVITPELETEGLARELERAINQFRKESGLQIGEEATLYLHTDSDKIKKALELVNRDKVYLNEIKAEKTKVDNEKELELNKEELWFGLKK